MSNLEWRDPLFLWTALLAPLVLLLAARTPSTLIYSSLRFVDRAPRSLRVRLSKLPAVLLGLATVALAVALAGPRIGDSTTKVKREGIAIVLAVDRSGSMDARDLEPENIQVNRLDVVKRVIQQFVTGGKIGDGRPDDLIGLVSFAGYADGLCPLTLDHANLVNIIDDLDIVRIRTEDGTAIGEGLALAVERLRQHPAKSKVVILLTDGENNRGDIDPSQAAELATSHGIKVYAIGAGTDGRAAIPLRNDIGEIVRFVPRYVHIDEESLRDIASRTGGQYYRATDAEGLTEAYREIDSLERTEITEIRYLQYTEHYREFVYAALGLITLSGVLSRTLWRRLP